MSTNYPGSLDSYTTKVDGVDDVLAAHINDPQDAIEALEAQHQTRSLLKIKNGAGATVAAGDVGYINAAGNFVRTTTANLDATWAVVIVGGANNTQIVVCRRGRVTITLNANCSIGDYLYTSTTAGQAAPLTYVHPEVLGVALTANAGGAGGTCEALLLTNTVFVPITSSTDIFAVSPSTDTDWRTTINGAPAGAVVTYTAPLTSGAEDCIVPTAATQYGKLRLYNETRGTYALIDDVDIGANTITLTAAAPGAWANTDIITTRSQTCVVGGPIFLFDIDLSSADNTLIPVLARALQINVATRETGAVGGNVYVHPWEAFAASSVANVIHYVVNIFTFSAITMPLIRQRFCVRLDTSGAGTGSHFHRIMGYWLATP